MYRFAPSPTGDMHIGNLRAAIFNYICSLQDKSGFILRIEDTDNARNIDGKDKDIMDILSKFGIKWQSLYYQHNNLKFHQQFAAKLLAEKKAYLCFCDDETLSAKKEIAKKQNKPYRYDRACANLSDEEVLNYPSAGAVRLRVKDEGQLSFIDAIKGEIIFEAQNLDDFVILRADKTPTYNFACAIDDMLQGVSFVIRGEDHVSNTPKQDLIRQAIGYDGKIGYAHLPIILNKQGTKMSKREKSSSVRWLLDSGYLPEAIANYLILLGNKTPCEIFTMQEAVSWFKIENISKSPAKFDEDRLKHINREHIKLSTDERLKDLGVSKPNLARFYTQECSCLTQINEKIAQIYSPKIISDEWKDNALMIKKAILDMEIYPDYDEFKNSIIAQTKLKGKALFMPLRLLLSGADHGPDLKDLYPLIKDDIKEIVSK